MNRALPYLYGFFFFFVIAGTGFYLHEHPISVPYLTPVASCAKPIPYTIGTIDTRFNLSKTDIAAKLEDAAGLWNDAAGKTVLVYAPEDPNAMPVNFVYDARQQTVTLGKSIDSTEASQDSERDAIEKLQQDYLTKQQAYASAVASFNADSQAYAEEVRRENAAGGADEATYRRLQSEQAALKQRQAQLNAEGQTLNQEGKELQTRISAFNADVHNINQLVQSFNSTTGDFEEGQYVRDASGQQHIDIYAFKDQAELIHSLAHEFGHSLGLEHNSNPASIMFPYNKSGVVLSNDDRADLQKLCGSSS